jgi:hypothetical protein
MRAGRGNAPGRRIATDTNHKRWVSAGGDSDARRGFRML